MNIGDRVKINRNEPNPLLHRETGTVASMNRGYVQVKLDTNILGWNDSTGSFDMHAVDVIPSVSAKGAVLEMVQRNREAMLNEVDDFRKGVEAGTLGDYSELGFLANLLQALTKD